MIDTNMLYKNSSNALMQARIFQSQASQKEFELKLMDINTQYPSYGANNPYASFVQKHNIESEIIRLKSNRDDQIFNAISYALTLADIEFQNSNVFSMAYLAMSSINSFLTLERISPINLPFQLQLNMSNLYYRYLNSTNTLLLGELQRLKGLCQRL